MGMAATGTATVRRQETRPSSTARRTKRTRRVRPRSRRFLSVSLLFGLLVCVFGYVSVYASLVATSYDRSQLVKELRQEKIRNERLRVDYVQRSGPGFAMSAAQRAGMVYATRYEYLRKADTMASAR
jgi:hypothetical protein